MLRGLFDGRLGVAGETGTISARTGWYLPSGCISALAANSRPMQMKGKDVKLFRNAY